MLDLNFPSLENMCALYKKNVHYPNLFLREESLLSIVSQSMSRVLVSKHSHHYTEEEEKRNKKRKMLTKEIPTYKYRIMSYYENKCDFSL